MYVEKIVIVEEKWKDARKRWIRAEKYKSKKKYMK